MQEAERGHRSGEEEGVPIEKPSEENTAPLKRSAAPVVHPIVPAVPAAPSLLSRPEDPLPAPHPEGVPLDAVAAADRSRYSPGESRDSGTHKDPKDIAPAAEAPKRVSEDGTAAHIPPLAAAVPVSVPAAGAQEEKAKEEQEKMMREKELPPRPDIAQFAVQRKGRAACCCLRVMLLTAFCCPYSISLSFRGSVQGVSVAGRR